MFDNDRKNEESKNLHYPRTEKMRVMAGILFASSHLGSITSTDITHGSAKFHETSLPVAAETQVTNACDTLARRC